MHTVSFTVPLSSQHEGSDRQYKRFLSDEAWAAAMAGPAAEHVLWPANGARGTEVDVVVTIYCDKMYKSASKSNREADLITEGTGWSLWNTKYPPKMKFHVRKPQGKSGPRAEVKVVQRQGKEPS